MNLNIQQDHEAILPSSSSSSSSNINKSMNQTLALHMSCTCACLLVCIYHAQHCSTVNPKWTHANYEYTNPHCIPCQNALIEKMPTSHHSFANLSDASQASLNDTTCPLVSVPGVAARILSRRAFQTFSSTLKESL